MRTIIIIVLLLCCTLMISACAKPRQVSSDNTQSVLFENANRGDASAQFDLGLMYYGGQGLLQDYTKAVYWFHRAAVQGHAEAQYNLGVVL